MVKRQISLLLSHCKTQKYSCWNSLKNKDELLDCTLIVSPMWVWQKFLPVTCSNLYLCQLNPCLAYLFVEENKHQRKCPNLTWWWWYSADRIITPLQCSHVSFEREVNLKNQYLPKVKFVIFGDLAKSNLIEWILVFSYFSQNFLLHLNFYKIRSVFPTTFSRVTVMSHNFL